MALIYASVPSGAAKADAAGFHFGFPARPETPIKPEHIRALSRHLVCQVKFDGSAKVFQSNQHGWCMWTRHGQWRCHRIDGELQAAGVVSEKAATFMDALHAIVGPGFTIAGELLDKSKAATPKEPPAHQWHPSTVAPKGFVVWDVMDYPGSGLFEEYLSRMKALQVPDAVGELLGATKFGEGLHKICSYPMQDAESLFQTIKETGADLYEGLVFRRPDASSLDSRGMMKTRLPKEGIYSF